MPQESIAHPHDAMTAAATQPEAGGHEQSRLTTRSKMPAARRTRSW
jgi:hypothetical protein